MRAAPAPIVPAPWEDGGVNDDANQNAERAGRPLRIAQGNDIAGHKDRSWARGHLQQRLHGLKSTGRGIFSCQHQCLI